MSSLINKNYVREILKLEKEWKK